MKYEDFENKVLKIIAMTILFPITAVAYILEREYYKKEIMTLRRGDKFILKKDTSYLSRDTIYVIKGIEGDIVSFENDKGWHDKIHKGEVHKIITL